MLLQEAPLTPVPVELHQKGKQSTGLNITIVPTFSLLLCPQTRPLVSTDSGKASDICPSAHGQLQHQHSQPRSGLSGVAWHFLGGQQLLSLT